MTTPDINVIIPTYNRSKNLAACLSRLEAQKINPDVRWNLIVVDNNSSDDTAETVQNLSRSSEIEIRYVNEPHQGVSFARNRGVVESDAPLLAFFDDDIRPNDEWLQSIYDTFIEYDCDAVSGRILLPPSTVIPRWIQPSMYGQLGKQDYGDSVFQFKDTSRLPFGGNMAIGRSTLLRLGMFDTRVGRFRDAKNQIVMIKGEETDFFSRLLASGGKIIYQPRSVVQHMILPHQLQKPFFRTLAFNTGINAVVLGSTSVTRTILGVPLYALRNLVEKSIAYIWAVISQGPDRAFRRQLAIPYHLGFIMTCIRERKKNRQSPDLES